MTALVVRRLLIDLRAPIARRWNGGDAFRTAFFNALSMSFPAGEQFFIDAVRGGIAKLPPEAAARFLPEAARVSSARRRRIGASTPGSTSTSRARATSTRGKGGSSAARGTWPVPIRGTPSESPPRPSTSRRSSPSTCWQAPRHWPAPSARHAVALACGRGVRAPQHGLRAVPRARRQPGVAPALDADCYVSFDNRPAAPDGAQPVARRRVAALDTWRSAGRFLFGGDGLVRHTWACGGPTSRPTSTRRTGR